MDKVEIYDISVIGAGPVGLFGVFSAGMRNMSVALVDSLPQVGGQLNALYPEKYIYDVPGFPKVQARKLVESLYEQATFAKPDLYLASKVQAIDAFPAKGELEHYIIRTEDGKSIASRAILLSLGIGAFQPRKLQVDGLDEWEGSKIHYILKPLEHYRDKNVLIIGGGDSAADWTLALGESHSDKKAIAKNITIIHRGVKFTAHESSVEKIKQESIAKIFLSSELEKVEEEEEGKLCCTIVNNVNQDRKITKVDYIIVCIGYVAKLGFVRDMGFKMKNNSILVNEFMETSKKGVFAAGDLVDYPGKIKLIVTGFGEASMAVNVAKTYIDPTAKVFPGHSTFLFGK